MVTITEAVTENGEFCYPRVEDISDNQEVWIRTNNDDITIARATINLYQGRSLGLESKQMCRVQNRDPLDLNNS